MARRRREVAPVARGLHGQRLELRSPLLPLGTLSASYPEERGTFFQLNYPPDRYKFTSSGLRCSKAKCFGGYTRPVSGSIDQKSQFS